MKGLDFSSFFGDSKSQRRERDREREREREREKEKDMTLCDDEIIVSLMI